MINELSQKLNWWLRSILLNCRHINIIYKDQSLGVALRTEHFRPLLYQLWLDVKLSARAGCLCTEIKRNRCQLQRFFVIPDKLLDDEWLACACITRNEDWFVATSKFFKQVLATLSVDCGHEKLEKVVLLLRIYEIAYAIFPIDEFCLLLIQVVIEYSV